MNTQDLLTRLQCEEVLLNFFSLLDQGARTEAAALFDDNAVVIAPNGSELSGSAVRTFIESRPDTLVTRHLAANVSITPTGSDSAQATANITVYRVSRAEGDVPPFRLPQTPQAVGDLKIHFRKNGDGWLITKYHATPIFEEPVAC
ncbi:nuclear transport factor 2 family protein [Microbulbifer pacificus]|uniref:Nuclear transport factor 2 family protein n=1 Tax=Microbulbifer pacificus TaxID=407164 RepID=A0AAU0N3S9_9GAMM|nr:nuclear transport factor 2 family protein [Microbulbifer pacificus]WOX07025.1 nuclear transport factor 2 family protein [Microbulbifer pacificus]